MAFISSGTTILDNGAFSVGLGGQILISEQTASSSASLSFTSGIDSTYDVYYFEFINIHPSNDAVAFQFNLSTDGGSNYNVTKTTTFFRALHDEADTNTSFGYSGAQDLAQSTAYQNLTDGTGNAGDECCSGTLQLFNPSSTTYVKHFMATLNQYTYDNYTDNDNIAGYANTTSAVNAVSFKFSSGNIDDGIIKMYGVK